MLDSSTPFPANMFRIIYLSHTHFHSHFSLACRIGHRVNTEWQWPLLGVHSIMMKILTQLGKGGGCTPTPFHYICHHVHSCGVRSS